MAPNQLNAAAVGFETNCSSESYINGVSYDILKKLQVVDTYQEVLEARKTSVSQRTANKVARLTYVAWLIAFELQALGFIASPMTTEPRTLLICCWNPVSKPDTCPSVSATNFRQFSSFALCAQHLVLSM